MHVAVIGSQGQLGSDLVRVLSATEGYEVASLPRDLVDVTDRKRVQKALVEKSFDVVVNCAAFTRVEDCEDCPAEALLVNGQGAYEIARACEAAGALCVHISTDYVFSGDKGSPYVEEDPVGPVNVYGASKLVGELLVRQAARRWLIVRVSSVFGKAGSRGKGANFVETILAKARSGLPVEVVNDMWMSPTYTVDAACSLEELIRRGATGVFHAANSDRCTWHQFASAAFEMAGISTPIDPVSSASYRTKAKRPRDSSLSNRLLEKSLGHPIRSWRNALEAYLAETGHQRR